MFSMRFPIMLSLSIHGLSFFILFILLAFYYSVLFIQDEFRINFKINSRNIFVIVVGLF